jgi:hypothetical protein
MRMGFFEFQMREGGLEVNWKLIILNSTREITKIDGKACEKLARGWRENLGASMFHFSSSRALNFPWNALRLLRKVNFSLLKLAKLPPKYASKHFRRLR